MEEQKRDLVFLSYAHDDLEKVWKVYEGLKERHVAVWFDKADLGPGKWYPQIMKKISQSRFFIFCVSNAALKKTGDDKPGFVDKELHRAYEIAMIQPDEVFTIVPVRLEDCERGDTRISSFQQYDLFEDFEKELDNLSVNIGGISLADAKARDERTEDEKLIESLLAKSRISNYAGEYETTIAVTEAIIKLDPKNYIAWNNKGIAFYYLDKYEESIAAYDKSIDIKPDYHIAWYNKGSAHAALRRYEQAIAAYDKAIEIKPDYQDAWNNKGIVHAALGRYEQAISTFDKAIETKPDYSEAWNNKGRALFDSGKDKEAIAAYDKAIDIKPDYQGAWHNKGLALAHLEQYEEAIAAYDKAIEIRQSDYLAWLSKGDALRKLGQYERAREALEKAKQLLEGCTKKR